MADSSLIGSAAIDINKIKAKLGEISQQNITLSINSQDILGKIGDVKSGLEALTNKPYDITLNIAGSAQAQIQNLQQQLNDINKQSAKQARNQQKTNRKSGGSSKKLEQSASFPVSRRKWAEKYRDEAQKEVDKYIDSLKGEGATLLSSSVKAKYNKTGKIIGYDGIVAYRDEVGKTVQAVLSLQDAQNKAKNAQGDIEKVWKVSSTTVNTSYEAQTKYLDEIQKKYDSIEKSAFSSKDALDRNSPFGAAATDSLKDYKAALDQIVNRKEYSNDSRANLEKLRQETQAVIEQQKALRDAQQYRDTYYTKQKAEFDKRYSEAFVQGINGTPLKDQFKKNAEGYFDTWNNELTKIQNQTTKVTAEQENKILELRTKAMLAAKEQQHAQAGGSTLVGPDITSKVSSGFTDITLLEEKLKQTGQYTDEAKVALDGFRESLARTENVDQFNAWNDSFKVLKGQIAEVQAETKTGVLADNFKLDTEELSRQFKDLKQQYSEIWEAKHTDLLSEDIPNTDLENGIESRIERINNLMNNINPQNISTVRKEIKALKDEMGNLEMPKDISSNISDYASKIDLQIESLKKVNQYSGDTKALIDGLKDSLYQVQDEDGLKQWAEQYKVVMDGIKQAQAEAKTDTALKSMEIDARNLTSQFDNLVKKYREITTSNPGKADAGIEGTISRLQDMFNNLDVSKLNPDAIKLMRKELTGLGRDINGLQPQTLSQVLTQNLGGVGQYLARFTSAFYIINKGIQTVKSMVNEVKSLDTSLMELQKVTSLSGDSLAQFTDNAYKTGKEVGRTGKDVIDAVTTFSRAGYNLEESNQLAKAALTMTNVGVDIPNTEAAASDMISILRAFDKQANESMQVIDELYNVANKEPLDFGNITDMLVTAGGTLAQSNTSLEETMGLLTAGYATLRDNSVANGLLQISQRLRGVKEDGEAIEEDGFMPKLKKAFGDVGVEIEDQNGELRSTFDILNDLAGVWDTLSSKQRQYLGEKAAGNRQVKVLNAIMANWDVVEDTIQKANEATGEATKGNEKYLDSIEGRITQFKSAFSDLARTTIDSDLVKGIVGFGTGVLNVTKDLGGLVPVLTTISGIIITLKGAKIAQGIKGIGTAISNMVNGVNMLSSGLSVVGFAITAIMGAFTVGKLLNQRMQELGLAAKSFETLKNASNQARQKYTEQENALSGLNTELENTRSLMSELESKGKLTIVEQEQYDELKKTNEELERQIRLQQVKTDIAQRESRAATIEAFGGKESQTVKESIDFGESAIFDSAKIMTQLGMNELNKLTAKVNKDLDNMNAQIITPESTYKEAVLSAFNTITYFRDNLENAQVELNKMVDSNNDLESLMNTNEYKTAEALRNYWQQEYDMRSRVLLQYQKDIEEMYGGDLTKITKPKTPKEKAYNQRIDEYTMIDDLWLKMEDASISKIFGYVQSKFKEEFENIQDLIKNSGEISIEDLAGNADYSGVIAELEKYGVTTEETANYLNELYDTQSKANLDKFKPIEELIKDNYFASDSYKALSTAMTEQQKSGAISVETYQKLIAVDKQLANVLTLTADGYALNSDAVNEYVQAKADEQKIQAMLSYDEQQQKLKELKKRYEDLSNGLIEVDDLQTEIANNQSAQKAAEQNMEALEAYIREINSATSALSRFKAAQSSANEDANFQDSKKVYDVIKEGNKTGKRNTDDFKTAVDYVLGDNWRENLDQFGGSVEKAYKHAEKLSKRYSGQKDEKTAVDNFMKDVGKTGLGTYNSKTGSLELNEDVTLGELSEKMKVSKEYLADMFKLLNTYAGEGEGFFFPEFFTDDDKKEVEARKKALEENEETQEKVGDKITDINKQIEEANKSGNEKEAQLLEQRKERLEETQKTLEQQHTDIENGVATDVDTMSIDDAKKKIDELYDVITALNGAGIDIPVTVGEEYNTLLTTFPQLRGELQNPLPPIVVKATGDALPKLVLVDGKVKQLEGDHFVDVDVNDNGTADATKDKVEDIENDKYDAKVDATLGSDTATGDIKNIASGPYDPASIGAEADNASLSSVGKELDDLAKPRTVTYTPQIPEMPVPTDVPLDDSDGASREPSTGRTKMADEQRSEDEWNNWFDWFDGTYRNGGKTEQSVEVGVEASQESGKQIVKQVQEQVDSESPVQEKIENNSDGMILFPGDEGYDELGVNVTAANPEEPIQQVQEAANSTPVEMTFNAKDSLNAGSAMNSLIDKATKVGVDSTDGGKAAIAELRSAYVQLSKAREKAESVEIGDEAGAAQAASNLQSAANSFMTAYNNLSTMTSDLSVDPIEVDANTDAALKKVQAIADKGVTVKVDGNTSSLASAIDSYNNRTITVNIQTNEIGGNAKGTKNAAPGPSLVDEEGAELIEHVNRGTYELGTNNGPRMTNLEKGDIVHTASETKRILSRVSKIGGFFKNGLNQAKSVLTGGAFRYAQDAGIGGKVTNTKKSTKKKKSSSKKSSSSSKKSSKSSSTNMKKLQEWFEKLFDWAEIRLERLQTITDEWIYKAGQAIGYAAQNTQLANAMKSVENQIKDTTAAYNLYIAQADKVAKKTKLSADIINRIQNGTIEISSYDKNTQQKIQYYTEWYNKAIACKEALQDLNEQEKELAVQRLDNVVRHYTNRANVYENIVKQREAQMNLAEAQGREQFASDYNTSITATNNKLNTLVQERAALNNEFNSLVAKGYIKKDSDEWFEYSEKIRDLDTEIITIKNDIIDLHDAANKVALTKLGYQLDQLANSAAHVDEMINLHSAQAIDEYASNYKTLIDNGMAQIRNLQTQNAEYRKQQQGLDKMSAKYQELEQSIQSNITAINQMKVSQEGWNDSVYDIQIDKINDFKDQLSKTNELYERQKNLQDAIQELEKAQGQRTQRVFRAGGTGFVYEADQEAVKEAQENLENVIQDELMSKMDDLIDALEESKENSNIYDANGNLLGTQYVIPQLDNLSEILSNYYSNPNNAPSVDAIRKLFMDELVSNSNTSNSNQASINIGDIIIQEAENGNDLANAIINQLPNALLQALYKKS